MSTRHFHIDALVPVSAMGLDFAQLSDVRAAHQPRMYDPLEGVQGSLRGLWSGDCSCGYKTGAQVLPELAMRRLRMHAAATLRRARREALRADRSTLPRTA